MEVQKAEEVLPKSIESQTFGSSDGLEKPQRLESIFSIVQIAANDQIREQQSLPTVRSGSSIERQSNSSGSGSSISYPSVTIQRDTLHDEEDPGEEESQRSSSSKPKDPKYLGVSSQKASLALPQIGVNNGDSLLKLSRKQMESRRFAEGESSFKTPMKEKTQQFVPRRLTTRRLSREEPGHIDMTHMQDSIASRLPIIGNSMGLSQNNESIDESVFKERFKPAEIEEAESPSASPKLRSRIYDKELSKFELKRVYMVRKYLLVLQSVNGLFNVQAIVEFQNLVPIDKVQQTFYILCFLIASVLIFKSYSGEKRLVARRIYTSLILLTIRNTIPMLNLETEEKFYSVPNQVLLLICQVLVAMYSTTMLTNLFVPFKWVYVTAFSTITYLGIIRHLYSWEELATNIASLIFVGVMAGMALFFQGLFLYSQAEVATEVFQEILTNEKQKQELQVILDNLEEGIIIAEEDKLDYCNHFSLQAFKQALDDATWADLIMAPEEEGYQITSNSKIFREYEPKTEKPKDAEGDTSVVQPEMVSLAEILILDEDIRNSKVYIIESAKDQAYDYRQSTALASHKDLEEKKFVQVRQKEYVLEGQTKELIQLIDISKSIQLDQEHAKSELLALINVTVSHEMRNPLNSILSLNVHFDYLLEKFKEFSTMLEQAVAQGEPFDHFLVGRNRSQHGQPISDEMCLPYFRAEFDQIHRVQKSSSSLLLYFVNDIIDFGRIRSKKFTTITEKFHLKKAIQEIIDILKTQSDKQQTQISVHVEEIDRFDHMIVGDRQRMQQVILNLLSNALKFTKNGKVFVRAKVYFEIKKQCWQLRVQVRDTGVGMTKLEQSKLFRLFGVLSNTKGQNSTGIGLGLVICKMIIEQLGGEISVVARKGYGSLFSFTMNLKDRLQPSREDRQEGAGNLDPYDEELAVSQDEQPDLLRGSIVSVGLPPADKRNFQALDPGMPLRPRILIVDDFQFNIDALKVLLKVKGINIEKQVHEAYDGVEAVHQVIGQSPEVGYDIIFMDCNMPRMDGYQASRKIKKECKQRGLPLPTIYAVTGHTEEQYVKQAFEAGMDEVFSKPINLDQVAKVISKGPRAFLDISKDSSSGKDYYKSPAWPGLCSTRRKLEEDLSVILTEEAVANLN